MRFTIGRLMIAVVGVALVLALFRAAGLMAGALVCGWLAMGWLAWSACLLSAEAVAYWAGFQAFAVLLLAGISGMVSHSWVGAVLAVGVVLLLLYPIHVGCSLGWMSAVRRANRTAAVPESTGLVWAYTLTPLGIVLVAFCALVVYLS